MQLPPGCLWGAGPERERRTGTTAERVLQGALLVGGQPPGPVHPRKVSRSSSRGLKFISTPKNLAVAYTSKRYKAGGSSQLFSLGSLVARAAL